MAVLKQYLDEVIKRNKKSRKIDWPGGRGVFIAQGDWSSNSMDLEFNIYETQWTGVKPPGSDTAITFSNDDMANFEIGPCRLRVNNTGGTGPVNIRILVTPSDQGWFGDNELL